MPHGRNPHFLSAGTGLAEETTDIALAGGAYEGDGDVVVGGVVTVVGDVAHAAEICINVPLDWQ